jgi:hypothetical protein
MFDEEYLPKSLSDLWFLKGLILRDLTRRYGLLVLWTSLVFLTSGTYLYFKGMHDGKLKYQHSYNFQLTMDSAFHYGYMDGFDAGHKKGQDDECAPCDDDGGHY